MNKYYLIEMFEPTLLYGLSLALLGVSAAYYYGHFSFLYAMLVIVGVVLAQISVNVISDYFDYTSGLDKELAKRKSDELSGGSSLIAEGMIRPGTTLAAGLATLAAAAIIGIYLLLARTYILPIIITAALSIFMYARYIKRVPYLSEVLCSFNYILISFGSFIVLATASSLAYGLLFSFIPAGIMLGGNALFVNSVPDKDIDKKYGARHTAIMLKTSKNIGLYYLVTQSMAFVILLAGIYMGAVPFFAIACFLAVPVTYYVFNGLYKGNSKKYGAYLSAHTLASFALAIILSASYLLAI